VVVGHTVGAASWLVGRWPGGGWLAFALVVIVALAALPTWRARRTAG
jgi:hypothetical protein